MGVAMVVAVREKMVAARSDVSCILAVWGGGQGVVEVGKVRWENESMIVNLGNVAL